MKRTLILVLGLLLLDPSTALAGAPKCFGRSATIVGTSGADRILGTEGRDVIVGLGGIDRIEGMGGADLICSGRGGNAGVLERVLGGPGDDSIKDTQGAASMSGGPGRDLMVTARPRSRVFREGGFVDIARGISLKRDLLLVVLQAAVE